MTCCSPWCGITSWPKEYRILPGAIRKPKRNVRRSASMHVSSALELLEAQRFTDAISELEQARSLNFALDDLDFYLGLAYEGLGDWRQALEHFQAALTKTPDDPYVLLAAGMIQIRLRQYEPALKLVDQA